jgi:hypothetical protein
MKNRARAALVVVACLIALTGCVNVDADLKVNSNETVSGSMNIGVDKQLMLSSGTSLDTVRHQVESRIKQTTTAGVQCKAFEDDKYVGSDCKFDLVPFSKMGASTGDEVGFRKDGDKFVVAVKALDLGSTDKLGNVSLASEASSGFPLWAIILIIVLLLAALGAGVFFVLRGRKAARQQQYQPAQYQQGQWGPQHGGEPGQQGMQYGQPGQPMQYGQPGQPMQYGQPAPGQHPGQPPQGPQGPPQGQPGQWGPPPQGQPPQQGHPPQQGGWGQPPQGNGGQGPEQS